MWEKLCAVNGDTEFVRADFSSFATHAASYDVINAAQLTQAAFADVASPTGALNLELIFTPSLDQVLYISCIIVYMGLQNCTK